MGGEKTESSIPLRLTGLQSDLLREFSSREPRLFLTGGAALVGFDFGHRSTDDLDFFAMPPLTLDEPELSLADAALAVGGTISVLSRHADFRRFQVTRGAEACVVDLVVDRAPAIDREKRVVGSVRIDTRREMIANKVCALISRSEIRDLIDLQVLLAAGESLEQALSDAGTKEAAADAATLAWTLDQLHIGPGAKLPGEWSAAGLEQFRVELIQRLRLLARVDAR